MKHLIPTKIKTNLRIMQRYLTDITNGQIGQFVNFDLIDYAQLGLFKPQITISQAIHPTTYSENKKHNLNLAIQKIQDLIIHPHKIFSFWHLVGNPSSSNGYLEGRVIAGNELKSDIGGGLCQLSGLLYLLTLKAGLVTVERHPHSQDIYTEATRFAPLGSDATIVYGYKDFRFRNNLPFPICFRFNLRAQAITASLCAERVIPEYQIEFRSEDLIDRIKVDTIRLTGREHIGDCETLNSAIYLKFHDP
jgi:vancomycin resistance protein VanW